jgi:hypothetical protein
MDVRRSLSHGPEDPQFFGVFRAQLAASATQPTRKQKYPSKPGGTWRFQSHDDLHDAGYRFIAHARCNVPVPNRLPFALQPADRLLPQSRGRLRRAGQPEGLPAAPPHLHRSRLLEA